MKLQIAIALMAVAVVAGFIGMFYVQGEQLKAAQSEIFTLHTIVKATQMRVDLLSSRSTTDNEVRAMPTEKKREELMLWATP